VTVILPDYPLDHLKRALHNLGFINFIDTKNFEPVETDGLRFITSSLVAPTDGAIAIQG
jgi:hypothetical protein